jgi:hypothetical protein
MCKGQMRCTYKILITEAVGKRHRWEDNLKMDLKEIGSKLENGLS